MPIQFKNSFDAGNVPNLIPGQIGINQADEYLWIRADGKKVAIDIARLQNYAAPITNGQDGAPLVKTVTGAEWKRSLAPSSEVSGEIVVDQPQPASIYAIPGVELTGLGATTSVAGNHVIAEHFYVASDAILIDKIAFKIVTQTAGLINIGIVGDDDVLIDSATISSPTTGAVNVATLSASLSRGHYRVIFWSGQVKELQILTGTAFEQGFNLDGSGNLVFLDHQYATANFSGGIDLSGVSWSDQTSTTPGVRRFFAYHWSIPA